MIKVFLLALAMTCVWAVARADVKITQSFGYWSVLSGLADDGKPACGVVTSFPAIGATQVFTLKWHDGQNIFLQLFKQNWKVPANYPVDVSIQFDSLTPWTAKFLGRGEDGDGIEVMMPSDKLERFATEMRFARTMIVRFPTGTEPPWVANMTGSNQAERAMGQCIMASRPATLPYVPQPPVASQPFVAPPASPQPQPVHAMPQGHYEAI
jgi:hypothetical protein